MAIPAHAPGGPLIPAPPPPLSRQSIARTSGIPIVLRGNLLSALSNSLTETGSFTLSSANGTRVAVNGSDAIVFHIDGSNARGLTIPVAPGTTYGITIARTFDVVIDRLGAVRVVNVPQGIINPVFHLSISGDWIAVQDGRYNLFSGEWIDMPQTWFVYKVAATPRRIGACLADFDVRTVDKAGIPLGRATRLRSFDQSPMRSNSRCHPQIVRQGPN
jgi:hypothetical protein